jgi:predicted enzyme related to lactoylglutathione lyase
MTMLTHRSGPFAAVMSKAGKASGWIPYVRVDDVAVATSRAVKLGAALLEDQTRGPAGTYSSYVIQRRDIRTLAEGLRFDDLRAPHLPR